MRSGAWLVGVGSLLASCYASDNKAQTKDGQSHWLEHCASQADCSSDQICACGVCTSACEASDTCGAGASCEAISDRACDGAASVAARVCLQACSADAPCEAGLRCVDSACVMRAEVVRDLPDFVAGSNADPIELPAMPDDSSSVDPMDVASRQMIASNELDGCADCEAGDLRIALLWAPQHLQDGIPLFEPSGLCQGSSRDDYGGQVAQPIDVEVSMPVFVDISALEPPPPEALVPAGQDHAGGWTMGHLVLYRDDNGNGALDPGNLEQASPDEILGTSGDWGLLFGLTPNTISYVIYYAEERLPEYGPTIEAGYNVFRDNSGTNGGGGDREAVPLDTLIPIPLSDTPKAHVMSCEEVCLAPDAVTCPATPADVPEFGSLECASGSSLWTRNRCEGCYCFNVACAFDEPCPTND